MHLNILHMIIRDFKNNISSFPVIPLKEIQLKRKVEK